MTQRSIPPVFVLGGAHSAYLGKFNPDFIWKKHPDFGKRENPTIQEHLQGSIMGALENAGVAASDVDAGYVSNFVGECFVNQGHMGSMAAGTHPDLDHKPWLRVEGACASGALALTQAALGLNGIYDIAVVAGAEVQTTVNAMIGADYLARAAHYASERPIDDFPFPALFARRIRAYMEKYDLTFDDLALLSAKAYANANRNPFAHMKGYTLTYEDARVESKRNPTFLSNEELRPYLKVSDCSQVSDGASSLILASEAGVRKLGKNPADLVRVTGFGHVVAALDGARDLTAATTSARAAELAYRAAGVGPEDIQVAELHDCFTINELLLYEACGFAERGKGVELVRSGATKLEGRLPVNTGGGLIGFGHPVGATGVKQALEITRQLNGECGDYQVQGDLRTGIALNIGGDDRTAVATIYQRG
jgi:acetyl-CoA acyltransferase